MSNHMEKYTNSPNIVLGHIAKHTHNIGEGALIEGLRSKLNSQSEKSVNFIDFDRKNFQAVTGNEFKKDSVSMKLDKNLFYQINKNTDGIIVGGGGIIQTGIYENFGGLCLAGEIKDFKFLTKPMFIYAIGDNRLKAEYDFQYVDEFKQLVHAVFDSGGLFSLRNDGSFDRLVRVINDDNLMSNIHVVPDPGLFIKRTKSTHPLIQQGKLNIALQLAGDRLEERLSGKGIEINENDFLNILANQLYCLSKIYDINVILCPHITSDYEITARFLDICSNYIIGNSSLAREIIQINYCTKGYDMATEFFSVYDQCDIALGMRGHASICSVGLGTPFIGLSSHEKLSGFLNNFGLENYSLDITNNQFGLKLNDLINSLIDDPSDWKLKRNRSFDTEEKKLESFNKKILKNLL